MGVPGIVTRHPLAAGLIALASLSAIVFVLLFFEPQALFIDDKVNEALPAAAQQQAGEQAPRTLGRGAFRGLAHGASGSALLIEIDGKKYLRFEDLDVSNGPDLKVYLSPAPASSEEGAFDDAILDLGDLKGNIGDQNYEIPPSVEPDRFRSAVVWCKRFGVGFAVAPLG
jgi:hypothetical protein